MRKIKVLNLIDKSNSDIDYTISRYPDGQVGIVLNNIDKKYDIDIKCRITNSDDLFILMQLSDIINRLGIFVHTINIYYLLSARTDRVFNEGCPFTLKIVSDIINSFNAYGSVKLSDVHSDSSLKLINKSIRVNYGLFTIYDKISKDVYNEYTLICPDAGSYFRLLDEMGVTEDSYEKNPLMNTIICSKKRDSSGILSGFKIENRLNTIDNTITNKAILIDDLCDAGGTFLGIYKSALSNLKESGEFNEISIFVTHAIQKIGIERLSDLYDKVYITNSYKDWDKEELPSNVIVIDIIE